MTAKTKAFSKPDRTPDWCDTVFGPLNVPTKPGRELFLITLEQPPKWFETAMAIRNMLVRPFGLKTDLEGTCNLLTRMPVVTDEDDCFETGIDDKHLTFTIEINQSDGNAYLTTNIWFNSLLGRIYLFVIKPGHILATRQLAGKIVSPVRRIVGGYQKAAIL